LGPGAGIPPIEPDWTSAALDPPGHGMLLSQAVMTLDWDGQHLKNNTSDKIICSKHYTTCDIICLKT
jgi:hypothetical protein